MTVQNDSEHQFQFAELVRIQQGDALDLIDRLPDDSIDMLATDPPYSSGGIGTNARTADPSKKYQSNDAKIKHPTFEGDTRDQLSYVYWSTYWLRKAYRTIRPGGVAATHKYDSDYGMPEICPHLRIIGLDWWMERHEYDGLEWWEFKRLPDIAQIPYGKVCIDNIERMPDMPSYVLGREEEDDE